MYHIETTAGVPVCKTLNQNRRSTNMCQFATRKDCFEIIEFLEREKTGEKLVVKPGPCPRPFEVPNGK